jgi:flavoprotein
MICVCYKSTECRAKPIQRNQHVTDVGCCKCDDCKKTSCANSLLSVYMFDFFVRYQIFFD